MVAPVRVGPSIVGERGPELFTPMFQVQLFQMKMLTLVVQQVLL